MAQDGRDGRDELLGRLASAPARIRAAAERAERGERRAPALAPDEWRAREVVGHLVSVETVVWQARLDQMAAVESPRWSWTEPGVSSDPGAATLEGALELLAAGRSATLERVAALEEAGWARSGIHATYGTLDVAGLLGIAADHDDDHLATLDALARR